MRREGRWHAASAVLLLTSDRVNVYVHLRTRTKDVNPGMHDCFAGGVVGAGERPAAAAERELAEELGVHGAPLRYLFRSVYDRDTVRFHGFVYEALWDGPVVHQPEEIASGGWMPLSELAERLRDPEWSFVPDGRQFIEEWFRRCSPPAYGETGPG